MVKTIPVEPEICFYLGKAVTFYASAIIIATLILLIDILPLINNRLEYLNVRNLYHAQFDFIIVGGGIAGSILAARLSSNPNVSVLLLEAGMAKPSLFNAPILGPMLIDTAFDWQHTTVPQTNACLAMKERRSKWPTGKLLGGTSNLNFMIHLPGEIADYQKWFPTKSEDWSESKLRYYTKRSVEGDDKLIPLYEIPYETTFYNTITSLLDSDDQKASGYHRPVLTMHEDGARFNFGTMLRNLENERPNLRVQTGVKVVNIRFDSNKRAIAVIINYGGNMIRVNAKKEIILSAGTVGSAHLLMMSGVGPKSAIEEAEVPFVADLPVGENLQDHVTTGMDLITSDHPTVQLWDYLSPLPVVRYFLTGDGAFTRSLCDFIMFKPVEPNDHVQIQLMFLLGGVSSDWGLRNRNVLNIRHDVWESYFKPMSYRYVISVLPVLLHPKSRGYVTLNKTNPIGPPIINPRYLSEEEDVEQLVDALVWLYDWMTGEDGVFLRNHGHRMNEMPFPGCSQFSFGTRNYFRCYVRHLTLTTYHPVGTCKMGPSDDPSSVVDYRLRVRGVSNLRVVDASVMPSLPSVNTAAPVMMIAERAADFIAEDWRQ